jgi:hypothetical protein
MTVEADNLDQASRVTQEFADREVRRISAEAAKIDTTNPSGECLFCYEPTGHDRRWCDAECRDLWCVANA